jgi:uncharacterized SAM-binding protein YcdF (DUF218 family)
MVVFVLTELGVPSSAVVIETNSRNTHENAVFTKPILAAHGWKSALLVTSAMHMPRALGVFAKVGIAVTPSSTDAHGRGLAATSLLDFVPNASALALATDAIKEYLGLTAYRIRGWT